ncbi:DUF305 domain-containing protein [Streptomyces sp. NPDC102264]|uniref:DUF305 domain-containing protein n=1 Tax=Streptomyces sp. NPDC102264 TaxID=3366149 RepID=UPI003816327F
MTSYRHTARTAATAAAVTAAALTLAACGGDNGSPSSSASTSASASASAAAGSAHNTADVSFATDMIPHHQQAVEMADLAATRASSAEVKKLAAEIKKAQAPEIRTLSGWLTSWGAQVPTQGSADHSAAGHSMPGMMAEGDMSTLEKASGPAFDTAFLKLMVKHHEGAVEMARTEKSAGADPSAKEMADAIITSQSAEITRMNNLLDK